MSAKILLGDCRETLKTLEPESVQTCVTSPPYWGLRDYGTGEWIGGDPECNHWHKRGGNGGASKKQVTSKGTQNYQYRGTCPKCGAVRVDNQLGAEATPEEYVANMVTVFREVWRVLKPDGTLWLNLGDSYAGSGGAGEWSKRANGEYAGPRDNANRKVAGLKPKDLVGIPWMVAFALRGDGWFLRSDIIWNKTNAMPEGGAFDRPTKAHEYLFLLTKSRNYYYDAEAIKEPAKGENAKKFRGGAYVKNSTFNNSEGANATRNKRTVWEVSTKPFRGAHFATFPPDLILPCILAGSCRGDIVLDPFNGAGTTGLVALKNNRAYIGCELKPDYLEMTNQRLGLV